MTQDKPQSKIHAKEPAKVILEKGKNYCYCTCGYSETTPFCDGAHREKAPEFKSLHFDADKDGEVYLCQCKATKNPPFCDGAHNDL